MIDNTKIIVKRTTSNEWIKDLNGINKDKIRGSFKSADGSLAKTGIGLGTDKATGLRKVILDSTEQKRFEKELGMPEGKLAPDSDFWIDFKVDIQGSELILDPNSPMDRLKLLVLKSKTKLVANGLEELKTKSNAEFVIVSEAQEAKKSNAIRAVRSKAYAAYVNMSPEDMADVLIAMGKKPTSMSREMIEDAMGREVDTNPAKFIAIYTNPKYEQLVFVNKLLNIGIIQKRGEAIIYEEDVLGYDLTSTIDFLYSPANKVVLDSLIISYTNKSGLSIATIKVENKAKKEDKSKTKE